MMASTKQLISELFTTTVITNCGRDDKSQMIAQTKFQHSITRDYVNTNMKTKFFGKKFFNAKRTQKLLCSKTQDMSDDGNANYEYQCCSSKDFQTPHKAIQFLCH
jgi:hypothetical protein